MRRFYDQDQVTNDVIHYWVDLIQQDIGTFTDIEQVKKNVNNLRDAGMLRFLTIENTGIFAYIITDDFLGGKCLAELMFYIRKEKRGDIRLVKRYLDAAERIAVDNFCRCVKIGSNIGYNDQGLIKLLKRYGYEDDTVAKYLKKER